VVVEAITRLNIGGPGRHVLDLARGLGHAFDVRIAAGTAPEVEGELHPGDIPVERLPLVRAVDPRRDAAALAQMRRLLARHDAGLVHSHMAKAGTIARLAAASLPDRPRTVHTFHGHVLSGYFSARTEAVFASIERRLARRTDVLLAVSGEVRDALLDLGIGVASQYEVVPLGVDLDPYLAVSAGNGWLRRRLRVGDDVPIVAVLARLAPIKDHRTLLEAMARVPRAHLALLGDGESRTELEELAQRLGTAGRTHFLGWCDDVPQTLADADVVALTSRNEGTPMALIEAGAAARPVVATDVGGVRSVVVHGRTGLLAPVGDATAVAAALQQLLDDPAARARFGAAALAHVEREFSLQPFLDRMEDIYGALLQRRPGRT
jgi:glycosyltransferase involved in cell wall biosynthesis